MIIKENRGVKNYNVIIQYDDLKNNKVVKENDLIKYLETNTCFYAFILHDKDVIETGEVKTKHYHIVLQLQDRKRKQTLLNDLARILNVEKNIISIDELINLNGSIRYLIHQDDINKYQYSREEILTNNIKKVNYAIDININDLTAEELIRAVKEMNYNKLRVMQYIGLELYKKYRLVINDIIEDYIKNY